MIHTDGLGVADNYPGGVVLVIIGQVVAQHERAGDYAPRAKERPSLLLLKLKQSNVT